MIPIDKLVRSKRKTLSLIIESDGSLTVRAPLRLNEADIQRFIAAKSGWIQRKQAKVRAVAGTPREFVDGETLLYLGKVVPLQLVPEQKPALVLDGNFKLVKSAQPQATSVFESWYKKQARTVLTGRVAFYAAKYGFEVGKLRISSARTRWGSCSAKKTLSFTWRIVMAPLDVIDYLVVHELCHLRELNHSRSYWAQVESILPGYKSARKWLKINGGKLKL